MGSGIHRKESRSLKFEHQEIRDFWCIEMGIALLSPETLLDFLFEQFQDAVPHSQQTRRQCHTHNAISMTYTEVDGKQGGQHAH